MYIVIEKYPMWSKFSYEKISVKKINSLVMYIVIEKYPMWSKFSFEFSVKYDCTNMWAFTVNPKTTLSSRKTFLTYHNPQTGNFDYEDINWIALL